MIAEIKQLGEAMRRGNFFLSILFLLLTAKNLAASPLPKRQRVLSEARAMLDNWSISYVMGGHKVSGVQACEACNTCLALKQPKPDDRLRLCPQCTSCSLDCSHFVYEVFKAAGLPSSYLPTALMNELAPDSLQRKYYLTDVGSRSQRALPGDLLVFDGHVVMLERKGSDGLGDVIHVTSGRDLRGPGLAIQRERQVPLDAFRGPLLRILRHSDLMRELRDFTSLRTKITNFKQE